MHGSTQDISFFHLDASMGLSDNDVNTATRDKNGLLWVGTANGLNCFDGYTVRKFFKEQYPELGSNDIRSIVCDERNRLWVGTGNNTACMIDEHRRFNKVIVTDSGKPVNYFYLLETNTHGIMYLHGNKLYKQYDSTKPVFQRLPWDEDTVMLAGFVRWRNWDADKIMFSGAGKLCLLDTKALKVIFSASVPGIVGVAKLNDEEALITTENKNSLCKYSLAKKKIIRDYSDITDQYGDKINSSIRSIRRLHDGLFLMTSGYAGVYVFDAANEKLCRYSHDPLNNRSVSANNTFYAYTDSSGYFFITTRTAGLNYFNINLQPAGYQPVFRNETDGKIFDSYIGSIARRGDTSVWMGTQSRLIEWNRKKNTAKFYDYGSVNGIVLNGNENIRRLCFDTKGRLWTGTQRFGLILLDEHKKPLAYFNPGTTDKSKSLPSEMIHDIKIALHDSNIWVSTYKGLCVIDKDKLSVSKMLQHPLFDRLKDMDCFCIWFRNNNEVWAGSDSGAWRYRFAENKLDSFNKTNGLSHNTVTAFAEDKTGNIYVGTASGLNRIDKNDAIKIFRKLQGLQNEKCESLLTDKDGNIWIANGNCLLQYDPIKNLFTVFDESSGLSNAGFMEQSNAFTANGELLWGTRKGVNFFTPGKLRQLQIPLFVMVTSFTAGNKELFSSGPQSLEVKYANNTILFNFSAIDLYGSKNIRYQYKLDGIDDDWVNTSITQQVIYSKLSPGEYNFHVRASRNGVDWVGAVNSVTVYIQTPWWRSIWFIVALIVFTAGVFAYSIAKRNRKIKRQKEALEIEKAINWFATSMNEKNSIEDILWDVTRNCIRHLKFEDCVIYLADADQKILVQKAAWGPKTTDENKILNPIEIPFGKGITGSVAQARKPEIVTDTSNDSRYLVDDARRSSEICVPILAGEKVLGVIDSEHSRKNFFTSKHLSILSTIASLCAVKILRAITEAEKKQTQEELQYMQQRAVETEMLALRAQMNPHFMFNSLNSINNFILKNDTDKASEYLTRFSQLMRMILDNSRHEWVLFENELKALQLYIELEAVRLKHIFSYQLTIEEDVNIMVLQVPPMLIQPYIENAIWHGLLHRQEPGGMLKMHVSHNDDTLQILIEDNGIGRKESAQMKSKYQSHKKSHGMKITAERIEIINRIYPVHVSVNVTDIIPDGNLPGTRVLLQIKRLKEKKEEPDYAENFDIL